MQIGNPGNLGINDVLSKDKFTGENMKLILPGEYRYISHDSIRTRPRENIIAGTAYLLMRACTFATLTLREEGQVREFTITHEYSNLEKISKAAGTTVDTLRTLNPGINPKALRAGQKLYYVQAIRKRVYTQWSGWISISLHPSIMSTEMRLTKTNSNFSLTPFAQESKMPITSKIFFLLFFSLPGFAHSENLETDFFEGRYHGQGRGCGGVLTIRAKNISWHSDALNCEITSYTTSEEQHDDYHHHIIYHIKAKNKACRLHDIKLGHDKYFPNYVGGWYTSGYFTAKAFENRQDPASASYACVLIKDFNSKNNPEPRYLPISE
ncbi:LysM domain-containing protein [Pseudomonas sp. RIT-PI-AD]|uniref:LysM peptidoglycan-binding domain-containing protein n=1 Tax=Pseudomonas sp. RIT-PI-AD TaxID=3035294 RepID=UPI0021DA83E9|nr:LysM domain-containing protein [Pseudomonas sp. RIT-PI-AD]